MPGDPKARAREIVERHSPSNVGADLRPFVDAIARYGDERYAEGVAAGRELTAAEIAKLRGQREALVFRLLSNAMGYVHCRSCGFEWYEAGSEPQRHRDDCPVPAIVAEMDVESGAIRAGGAA